MSKNNHSEAAEGPINKSPAGILKFLAPSQTEWQEIRPDIAQIKDKN